MNYVSLRNKFILRKVNKSFLNIIENNLGLKIYKDDIV